MRGEREDSCAEEGCREEGWMEKDARLKERRKWDAKRIQGRDER